MVEMASIGAAISGLKAAGELAGSFLKLRDVAAVQGKVIELQTVILSAQQSALSAQSEQLALAEEKRRLEKQIADLEAWDREKQRYELKEVAASAFAYALKAGMEGGEPPHHICAKCFNERKKTILQARRVPQGRLEFWDCHTCDTEILIVGPGTSLAHKQAPGD
jgi:hypothetical protein